MDVGAPARHAVVMMKLRAAWGVGLGVVVASVAVFACGGAVVDDAGAAAAGSGGSASGGAGASAAGAGGHAGGAKASGGAGVGGAPAQPCTVKPASDEPFSPAVCADLSVLAVTKPALVGGSGHLSAGGKATVAVELSEIAGEGFNFYPGVTFTTDHAGVQVAYDDWRYAILACQTEKMTGTVTVSPDVPSGTVVTVTARAAMLGEECPDAPSTSLTLTVQ